MVDVHPSSLITKGDRSFASAGSRIWSSVTDDVIACIPSKTENTPVLAIISRHCAIVVLIT